MKEHEKLYQKLVSKVTLHFVWDHLSRKQTVHCSLTCVQQVSKTTDGFQVYPHEDENVVSEDVSRGFVIFFICENPRKKRRVLPN